MSKKHQPQNKENPKNKIQTVEQQNEPFLKALQKKVRNLNKKLTQISELENKDNLKPEQIQKINRKDALIEERAKLEETGVLYKETYAENTAFYRTVQLKELQILARGIAIYHSGFDHADQEKLSGLWKSLEITQGRHTLNQNVLALSNALKDFANDRKLQKNLSTYLEQHGEKRREEEQAEQEKIVHQICEEKAEVKPEVKVEPVKIETVTTPVVVEKKEEVVVEAPKAEIHPPAQIEEIKQEVVASEPVKTQNTQVKKEGENRPHREPRNKGNYRGDYKGPREYERREGDNQGRRYDNNEKRQYRQKYQEKGPDKNADDGSDSSLSPETREFRRDEIRKLEEDGFTVVGKPKPKAKEAKEWHDHEHGKKFHHNKKGPY